MKSAISFFDLDHTILHVNCSFHFGLYLYKKNIIGAGPLINLFWNYFLHKCGRLDIYAIHQRAFDSLFRGKESEEFGLHVSSFVDECYHGLINPAIVSLLDRKKEQGERVVILSSSPDFLVKAFARKMGVEECYGTVYQTDGRGRYLQIEKVFEGGEKSKFVKRFLSDFKVPKENTSAYSDSHHDLPFLESVAKPFAVNPNKKLSKVCRQRGWEVIN